MSSPFPYLIRMLIFLAMVGGLVYVLQHDLVRVFLNTPILNGVIMGVLALGIFFVFRQVLLLWPEVKWLRRFQQREGDAPPPPADSVNLLAPMAAMLGTRHDQFRLSPTAARALLDGIATRLDERRELARYLIGLLIFLGLLGTFWGLLETIGAVADAIAGLQVTAGDSLQMFAKLKASIEGPLKGMSIAFGASLFGLSGSLVLGFLELQASQAQGRFHTELEEWLASATSIASGAPAPGGNVSAYVEALLERNAEGVDGLVRTLQHIEESRQTSTASNATLVERLGALAETMRAQQLLLARLAELSIDLRGSVTKLTEQQAPGEGREAALVAQRKLEADVARLADESTRSRVELIEELRALAARVSDRTAADADREALLEQQRRIEAQIARLADDGTHGRVELVQEIRGAVDRMLTVDADRDAMAAHQRNIDAHLARLAEETAHNRSALADELRGEIRLLARTIAASRAPDPDAPPGPSLGPA
ncbi:MAG: flagellar motor protein MotA [Enhydrobacter sp.]|nr:MAG: flagellar motor protein MotA [Enhydrobacter sp.]